MIERTGGFTLLEFMVALAIIGILLGLGAPSFREYTRNSAAAATQTDLITAFSLARSEALKRSRAVSVCASKDGIDCSDASADWQAGWLVFVDDAPAGQVDATDEPLQFWRGPRGDVRIDAASAPFIRYLPTGMIAAAAPLVIDVDWPDCAGESKRRVAVSVAGTTRSSRVTCS
jgi:type IV fimbrial biogenesis protein FimT